MPNITWAYWITVPIGIIMFGIAIWIIRDEKTNSVESNTYVIGRSEHPVETLTNMHRRVIELQHLKAHQTKIGLKQLEK